MKLNIKEKFIDFCFAEKIDDKIRIFYIENFYQELAKYLFKTHKKANSISFGFFKDLCGSSSCSCINDGSVYCELMISNEIKATPFSMYDVKNNMYLKSYDEQKFVNKYLKAIEKISDITYDTSIEVNDYFKDFAVNTINEQVVPYVVFYKDSNKITYKIFGKLIGIFK